MRASIKCLIFLVQFNKLHPSPVAPGSLAAALAAIARLAAGAFHAQEKRQTGKIHLHWLIGGSFNRDSTRFLSTLAASKSLILHLKVKLPLYRSGKRHLIPSTGSLARALDSGCQKTKKKLHLNRKRNNEPPSRKNPLPVPSIVEA